MSQREKVKPRVAAQPVSGMPGISYPVYSRSRQSNPLDHLVDGLSKLQPSLGRYAEEKARTENEASRKQAAGDFAEGKGMTSDEHAYVETYHKFEAEAAAGEYWASLNELKVQHQDSDPATWKAAREELRKQFTEGMPETYLQKFLPKASQYEGTVDGAYRKRQVDLVRQDKLTEVNTMVRYEIERVLAETEDPEAYGEHLLAHLRDLQENAKALEGPLGIKKKDITAAFLQSVGQKAEREGIPELLEWLEEPITDGVSIMDMPALRDEAMQYYRQAERMKQDKLRDEAAAMKASKKAAEREYTNNLIIAIDQADPRKVEDVRALREQVYASKSILPTTTFKALVALVDRKNTGGYPEMSDPDVKRMAYIRAYTGQMSLEELVAAGDFLTRQDENVILQAFTSAQQRDMNEEQQEERSIIQDAASSLQALGNPPDPMNPDTFLYPEKGKKRAQGMEEEFLFWVADKRDANETLTRTDILKKRDEILESRGISTKEMYETMDGTGGAPPWLSEEDIGKTPLERAKDLQNNLLNLNKPTSSPSTGPTKENLEKLEQTISTSTKQSKKDSTPPDDISEEEKESVNIVEKWLSGPSPHKVVGSEVKAAVSNLGDKAKHYLWDKYGFFDGDFS